MEMHKDKVQEPIIHTEGSQPPSHVLYEEDFTGADWFWRSQTDWARGLGFRVVERDTGSYPFRSVASTLPAETLLMILDHALLVSRKSELHASWYEKRIDKTVAINFGLACRAWASRRYGVLFDEIKRTKPIYGASDAPRFVSLVAENTRVFALEYKDGSFPPGWIHRYLCLSATPATKRKTPRFGIEGNEDHSRLRISFRIDLDKVFSHSPHGKGLRCRSLFSLCPKPLPLRSSQHLLILHIENYRFSCFSDLMHLVWELPSARLLTCNNLSWDQAQPLALAHFSIRDQVDPNPQVYATECADVAPFIWMQTSVFRVKMEGGSGLLAPFDALALLGLVRAFVTGVEAYVKKENLNEWVFNRWSDTFVVNESNHYWVRLELKLCLVPPHPANNPHDLHITQIEIHLDNLSAVSSFNWPEIDRHASTLLWDATCKLKVCFSPNDEGEPPPFALDLCAATARSLELSRLQTEGKLEFRRGGYVPSKEGDLEFGDEVFTI